MPIRLAIVVSAFLLLVVVDAGLAATVLHAQSGGPYELAWTNTDAAGTAAGGVYELNSLVGQPEAGSASGSLYELEGGAGGLLVESASSSVYLPVLLRPGS